MFNMDNDTEVFLFENGTSFVLDNDTALLFEDGATVGGSATTFTFPPPEDASQNITELEVYEPALLVLRTEPWALPLLILSSINIAAIAIFEVYVLYKSCGSRRHLFLGQVLMLGLFLCSFLGYAFVLEPRWFLCALTRAGVGLAYVLVFATLLVKCLFLLGLHSGIYINSAYQSMLLLFAFGIQVAISAQWLAYVPPEVVADDSSPIPEEFCKVSPVERVQYLSYAMLLVLMVVVAAVRARALKENNREALYIGITIGILVVLWVAWTAVLVIFGRRFEDPAQGFGLTCSALVTFLLVFVPKAIQLSLSSRKNGSTNGSQSMVFTPSFLHLQPHAVLPTGAEGTLIKQQSCTADYCRGYGPRLWHADYPTFYKMEPQELSADDSQGKSNVTFIRMPT